MLPLDFLHGGCDPAIALAYVEHAPIRSSNNVEWIITQYATARMGAVLVNINPSYQAGELLHALNAVQCAALIVSPSVKQHSLMNVLYATAPELRTGAGKSASLPHLHHVFSLGDVEHASTELFAALVEQPATGEQRATCDAIGQKLNPSDVINIQFTSGTTGRPKGAALTHRGILNNGRFVGHQQNFSSTTKGTLLLMNAVSLDPHSFHHFAQKLVNTQGVGVWLIGMVMGSLAAMTHGAAIVLPSALFDAQLALAAVEHQRCTALYGVPTMFIDVLDVWKKAGACKAVVESLDTGIMAGSPCPVHVMAEVSAHLCPKLTICYGMTETSPVSFQTSTTDDNTHRCETVGRVQPHVEARVVDPGTGEVLPRGQAGELHTRGYLVMRGYWGDAAQSAAAVSSDGWMRTGDLATIDNDGYCRVVGRLKDMLIRGGENVYPVEIENALFDHPGVKDVQVVGVPDAKYGEEVCAVLVPADPAAPLSQRDVAAFLQGKLSHFKIPRYVINTDSFPLTVTGKVQKYLLRQIALERLGLSPDSPTKQA